MMTRKIQMIFVSSLKYFYLHSVLMLQCVFSDGEFHYPSVTKEGKETAGYSIVSKTVSEILLQSETNEVKNGAACLYVIAHVPFTQFHAISMTLGLNLFLYMDFSTGWLLICRLSQAVRLDAQGALRYAQLTPFDNGLYWCFR
jgi:hypothetical protein